MQQHQRRSKNQKYSAVVLCPVMVLRTSLQWSLVCNCRGILGFLLSWHSADTDCWPPRREGENPREKIVEIVQCRRHHQEAEERRKLATMYDQVGALPRPFLTERIFWLVLGLGLFQDVSFLPSW